MKLKFGLAILMTLTLGHSVIAQGDSDQLLEMSLEDLMNMKVTVASKNAMSIRESPGIVTVLTEKEIVNSGANDLMEVLRLVPGFEFGVDVSGATGATLRGNIAYIGRVLLMIDGQEVNELFYSCSFADNHYPVDNIKRIEIIRGPGSAIYGGFAELGVINVITKNGEDLNGVSATVNYGQMKDAFSHRDVSIAGGKKVNDDLMFSVNGYISQANRSNRENVDFYGESYNMANNSLITSIGMNTNLKFKGLNASFILDDYTTNRRDQYDINMNNTYDSRYKLLLGELKYDFKISDKLTLTPKYNAVYSVPWQSIEDVKPGDEDNYLKYDRTAFRNRLGLTANVDISEDINLIAGGEYIQDNATTGLPDDPYWNGKDNITYNNASIFSQAIWQNSIVNITLGARADKHSQFGTGFAPRLGFTKAFDKLHMKLLFSQAYRAPSIDEIDGSTLNTAGEPDISPEVTQVAEFEIGYQFTPELAINANTYYSKIDNTILFTVVNGIERYSNSDISGSKGFEVELLLRKKWGFANLNYSFYSAKGVNKVGYYSVIDETVSTDIINLDERQMIGTSPHKIALNSSFNVYKGLHISPSFTYMGSKYAYTEGVAQVDGNGDVVLDTDGEEVWVTVPKKQDAILLLNTFINYHDLLTKGLSVSAGVHNILDAKYNFSQPYNGWHSPLPGEGRRISAKITYDFKLN
jgi:outer membrane receptor for ferrienterochelin and colicin